MKCIVYAPTDSQLKARTKALQDQGHEVLVAARTSDQLRHHMAEFEAYAVIASPINELRACRPGCAASLFELLIEEGHAVVTTPQVWEATLRLCLPTQDHQQLLAAARSAFQSRTLRIPVGLECLPTPWLAGLPRVLAQLADRFPGGRLPLPIFSVVAQLGVVEVTYVQDNAIGHCRPGTKSWWAQFRRELNLSLYPSLWRPLKRGHWQRLYAERPDLRPLLERAPWKPEVD